jgi:hypothetical protein
MPYGKVDELAINTIRTLAVRFSLALLPHHAREQLPRYRDVFLNTARRTH